MKLHSIASFILLVLQLGGLLYAAPLQSEESSSKCNSAKGVVARSTNPAQSGEIHLLADLAELSHGIKRDEIEKEKDCSDDATKKSNEDQSNKEAAISAVPGEKREAILKAKQLAKIVSEDDESKIAPIIEMAKSSVRSHVAPKDNHNGTALNGTANNNNTVHANETRTQTQNQTQNQTASTAIAKGSENKRTNLHHHKTIKKAGPSPIKLKVDAGIHNSAIVPDAAEAASKSDGIMDVGSSPPTTVISKAILSDIKSSAPISSLSNVKSALVSDTTPLAGLKSSSISNSKSASPSTSSHPAPVSKAASKTSSTTSAVAKKPAAFVDPYAEIAEGPDSPKLPELKTGNEGASDSPPPMLKMDQGAGKSPGGHAPNPTATQAAPPPAGLGGGRNSPQDVGGLLDRLTDRLNTAGGGVAPEHPLPQGGGVAPEQPLPQGESKSIQEQLSQFDDQALQQAKGWESSGVKAIKALKMGELTGAVNDLSGGRPLGGAENDIDGGRPMSDLNGGGNMGELNGGRSTDDLNNGGQTQGDYNDFLNDEATREEQPGGRYSSEYTGNMGNRGGGGGGGGGGHGDMFEDPGASYIGAANAAMGNAGMSSTAGMGNPAAMDQPGDSFERRTILRSNRFEGMDDSREPELNGYDDNRYFKRSIILRPIYYYYKHMPYAFKHPYDD